MGKLRDRMLFDLRLRGFSETTQSHYILRVRKLAAYFKRSPEELGAHEVRTFLRHLIEQRKLSKASHSAYVAAIKFCYTVTICSRCGGVRIRKPLSKRADRTEAFEPVRPDSS